MAIPDGPVDNSTADKSRSAQPGRSRWERYGLPALILVLPCGLVLLEGFGIVCQRQSVQRIKAWAQSLPSDSKVSLKVLEAQLSGSPRRKAIAHQGTMRIVYTWPSVIGTYRLRGQVTRDGNILYLDTETDETEDFATPFLVANADGIRVVVPGEPPPSHEIPELNIDPWEETRFQFARPKVPLQPGLVIFPIVDDQRAITTTGLALSTIAQYSLVYTPIRRMALNPRLVQQTLTDCECWLPGTILDQPKIDMCLKAVGAETYALSRIREQDGKWRVQIEVCRSGGEARAKIDRQANALNLVPGEIALGLFEHLKVVLSPEEIKVVAAPQASLTALSEIRQNSAPARSLKGGDRSHVGFIKMLKMTPSFRGDADFHQELVEMARGLKNDKLVDELLRIWRAEDNGYASRVARAQTLAGFGWAALQNEGLTQPTPAMRQASRKLFEQAQAELEQALVLNPQGVDAHTEMIQGARGLEQPWPKIQAHLENALRLRPGHRLAWQYAARTTGRRGPKNAANAYQFAEFCLANGKWREVQEVPDILRGAAYDPEKRTFDFRQFQSPEHWPLIQKYYRLAQQQQLDGLSLRWAQAHFAHVAAITGHYAEAAPVFDLLDLPFKSPPTPPNSSSGAADPVIYLFGSKIRYAELRDLVRDWKHRSAAP